ncbi:hypothetical protein M0802_006638 [Mischocyttarus mexicanus]|nr:hypothetical protein M0802_006638 [Mischocyttarus mexicanus]
MQNNSTRRRSSTNPVRISTIDKVDKSVIKNDSRKTLTSKSKSSICPTDVSHIPVPRMRSSSCDPGNRLSNLKSTGKNTLHVPTTPATPLNNNARRLNVVGLSTGRRTPSKDRASNIGTKGTRKDTRILLDKNYQSQMLYKIDTYINDIQCSSMLNANGSLKPITLKMFVEVSDLLVKLIDPKQTLTLSDYIEQLPKIAKKLHYPGMISKSFLKTANTPHAWPYVLGWLCWLVEVCQVKDLAYNSFQLDNLPFIGTEQQMKENKNYFFFMLSVYGAWNDEKLEEEATLVKDYLQEIEKEFGVTDNDLAETYASIDEEEFSLQETKQQSKDIEEEVQNLKDMLMSLEEDLAKQTSHIKAGEEYIKNLDTDKEQYEIKDKYLHEKIQMQTKQHKELLLAVKEQTMSKREKEDIIYKCSELQTFIQQFDEHLKEMQKDIYKLDIKIASVNRNLNKIVLVYNQEIFKYFGSDTNLDVEELKMPEKDLLDPNIMDNLNSKANLMNELKDGWNKDLIKLESYIEADTNKLELLQRQMNALEEKNVVLHNNLKDKKANINNWKNEENRLREEIQILQNEIQSYTKMTPDLQILSNELEELKEKLDAVNRRKLYIEQNGKRFFEKLYEILGSHRNNIMSNKIEETCKTLDQRNVDNTQNPLKHNNQRIFQNEFSSNYKTIVEVKVKEMRPKPTHAMVARGTSNREPNTEEGQRFNGDHHKNWLQNLQKCTRPYVKNNLQSLTLETQNPKKISSSEPKDNKKHSIPSQQSKYRNSNANKELDEVPVKQVSMQKILKEKKSQQTGPSSGVSSKCIKCTKSVLVTDKEVQCGGIFDSSYDKFNGFDPVRTLGFLMKELESLIKDEKSSDILWEMEQTLIRIPVEYKKSTIMGFNVLTPRTRLDESTTKLEKVGKKMSTLCGSLRDERDSLKRDLDKHSELSEEAWRKLSDLETMISNLKEELNEALKTIESKNEIILELQKQSDKVEPLENELTKLRKDLSEQMELKRQSCLEVQYLMLENEKLSVIISHKDSQVNEFRDAVNLVLQKSKNEIERSINLREENSNIQSLVTQRKFVCSSPSPTSSELSNIPTFYHDSSDTSISIIEHNENLKEGGSKKDNLLTKTEKDMTKMTIEEINESKNNRDSTQLKLISLPPAESISFPSYRDQECLDESSINKDKDDYHLSPLKSNKLSNRLQQFVDNDSTKSSVQCIITEKDNERESYNKKHSSKIRKTLQFDNKKNNHCDDESIDDDDDDDGSKFIETNVSSDMTTSNINKQLQNIFDEVRCKSRIPVNVPSPPRHYPHPDFTNSTLPSVVSIDSELNMVQSNIT